MIDQLPELAVVGEIGCHCGARVRLTITHCSVPGFDIGGGPSVVKALDLAAQGLGWFNRVCLICQRKVFPT